MTHDHEEGAAAVEFALVTSLLLLLLLGIVQFGIAFFRYQGVQAAAREGARVGALQSTTQSMIAARVDDVMSDVAGDGTYALDVDPGASMPCNSLSGADQVIVNVDYTMDLVIPLWKSMPITMTGVGEFRCEK